MAVSKTLKLLKFSFTPELQKWRAYICCNILEGVHLVVNNGMKMYKKKFTSTDTLNINI